MSHWQPALHMQSETAGEPPSRILEYESIDSFFFSTVKPTDFNVQEFIPIFHYRVLGYITVEVAMFCQLQFIWILVSKTRNTLHLAERRMCTEPN